MDGARWDVRRTLQQVARRAFRRAKTARGNRSCICNRLADSSHGKAKLQNLVLDLWEQESDITKRKNVFFVTHEVDEALLLATKIIVLCQTPAKVIYEHSFAGETHPTRENMYTDPSINEMRQSLIRLSHEDAYDRAQHDI